MDFSAQPPDLRRVPLVARASRSVARSPWSTAPRIRFLFVGSRPHYPLPSVPASRPVTLRFVWVPATRFPGDLHLLSTPMLGAPPQKPMAAEQPWALDLMSFGLACRSVIRSAARQFNNVSGEPRRTSGPPAGEVGGHDDSHFVAGVSGTGWPLAGFPHGTGRCMIRSGLRKRVHDRGVELGS